jgi:hypothetical protein
MKHYDNKPAPNLPSMCDEMLLDIAGYLSHDPKSLLSLILTSKRFYGIVNSVRRINQPLESLSKSDDAVILFLHRLCAQAIHSSVTALRSQSEKLKVLSVLRKGYQTSTPPSQPFTAQQLASIRSTIMSFIQMAFHRRMAWYNGIATGDDRRIMCLLLTLLPKLEQLELEGTASSLPAELSITARFDSLRVLKLRNVLSHTLSASCCYLISLPSLEEVDFSDMTLWESAFNNFSTTTLLSVKVIRLLNSCASTRALSDLLVSCHALEAFEYTFNHDRYRRAVEQAAGTGGFSLGGINDQLLKQQATLKRLVVFSSTVVMGGSSFYLRNLDQFPLLEYVYVNHDYVSPRSFDRKTLKDGHAQTGKLQPSVKTLKIRDCNWHIARLILRTAAMRHWPLLTTLKLRIHVLRPLSDTSKKELENLVVACEAVGISVHVLIKPSFQPTFNVKDRKPVGHLQPSTFQQPTANQYDVQFPPLAGGRA